MLRKRLVAGTILAAAMGGVLVGDARLAPYYPCLLACALLAAVPATRELRLLLPATTRPPFVVCGPAVVLVLLANWWHPAVGGPDPWRPVLDMVAASALIAFLYEMARYREAGPATVRVANTIFAVAYLGLLPSFFLRIRWHFPDPALGSLALAATIFVPKCGDIGAYFTGRFLGRHRFTPLLSPKKTWEGFAGGTALSVATAVGLGQVTLSDAGPLFPGGMMEAVGFGIAVGLAGVLGDLAESMVKRDAGTKDAAQSVPGFGGVLDVIDSVVFAGPLAYWWFASSH